MELDEIRRRIREMDVNIGLHTPEDVDIVANNNIRRGDAVMANGEGRIIQLGNLGDNIENRDAIEELAELTRRQGGHAVELAGIAHEYAGIVGYMVGDRPVRLTERHDDRIDAHEIAMRQFTGHPRDDIRAEPEEANRDFWERNVILADLIGEYFHSTDRCTVSYTNPKPDKVVMSAKKEVVIPKIDRSIR